MRPWVVAAIVAICAGVVVASLALGGPNGLFGSPSASPSPTAAPRAGGFDYAALFVPGHIISDETMFEASAMTQSQIQLFLHDAGCRSADGSPCLWNFRQSTQKIPADRNCRAIPAQKNVLASQIIATVTSACGINPEVILVLLQKEQSLVTAPTAYGYQRATGYACPDSKPCDTAYFGFFNQVYKASRQFKEYTDPKVTWPFHPGRALVSFAPQPSCGAGWVTIENQATADLYNYTPYQPTAGTIADPDDASLPCSSHGNLNFFVIFSRWFGDPRMLTQPARGTRWLRAD